MNIEINKRSYHIANRSKGNVYKVNTDDVKYYYEVRIAENYFEYDSLEELKEHIISDLENAKQEVVKQLIRR